MNTVAKGRRNENKTHAWLEERGFIVETTQRSSYRGNSNDFFGCFDHIAVPTDKVNWQGTDTSILFVQTRSNVKGDTKEIEEWITKLEEGLVCCILIFVWKDRVEHPIIYSAQYDWENQPKWKKQNYAFGVDLTPPKKERKKK